ncbi:MAG: hypothetical protein HYR73_08545 [Candidatus Eisenbacteria bacterium]|nr:hypothetical protein [Candidatus Eisenbacteria bacterium]
MGRQIHEAGGDNAVPQRPGHLRGRTWKRFLHGPDPALREELYVPALAEAVRYDRCCAYFSSSVLAAAARGFGALITRLHSMGERAARPAVRLVVNEELSAEDVRALSETRDLTQLEAMLQKRFKNPQEALEKERLAMLGWLVKQGLLEVRVGVMRRGEGIVHAKFGVVTDESGDAVVFSGSGNETAQGLLGNYERLDVSTSWDDTERHQEYVREFELLWSDGHPDVHTVSLPEALRLRLIRLAPKEPPVVEPSSALERQRAAMAWRFVVEAPYLPNGAAACDATALVDVWPHQQRVIEETAEAWPEGRLLCDEVGMGKTIEAILVLRRLLAGRGVRRALILVPAGLLRQWQGELREKGGLLVPRFEGENRLVHPDDREQQIDGIEAALKCDLLLMSRETARTERNLSLMIAAQPWDLVILDEAHAARRRKLEEGEFNSGTLLLDLLRGLQLRGRARGFLLLSATPMQTHPVEPWDLLAVLGEGEAWLSEFATVRNYYGLISGARTGKCDIENARRAAAPAAGDEGFPPPPGESQRLRDADAIARKVVFAAPSRREEIVSWLRSGSPLARRMHRNTRATLRRYHEMGLLPTPPPERIVEDERFDFREAAERRVYDAVGQYIERRFRELESEKAGKGFVMTVYRRRASSSPAALEQSLERRRDGLMQIAQRRAFDDFLAPQDVPEGFSYEDLADDESSARVSAALPQDPQTARRELAEVENLLVELRALRGVDSKRDRFFDILRRVTDDGRAVLVFSGYVDTMHYLRDQLHGHYGDALGCYSGEGGEISDEGKWTSVTKDAITAALRAGRLRVLVCTDAASEGLNLQAAGAVINYDLPWNPSRVEQRIGRVDRIGQKLSDVRVVNLFLENSIDDQVYRALRARCGLFEHFVGAMQPVLALARKMLEGRVAVDVSGLDRVARDIEEQPVALEIYEESGNAASGPAGSPVSRNDLVRMLSVAASEIGVRAKISDEGGRIVVSGARFPRVTLSSRTEILEHDRAVVPLVPEADAIVRLADILSRPGEQMPLVFGTAQSGGYRRSLAFWVAGDSTKSVSSLEQLNAHLGSWSGELPDPAQWLRATKQARSEAERQIRAQEELARKREREGLARQVSAAQLRLRMELGRYLVCFGEGAFDLGGVLQRQLDREIGGAARLRDVIERLGDFPVWTRDESRELDRYAADLPEGQRRARLTGSEIDAALEDPRWRAAQLLR